MATVRDICTRALRRIRELAAGETASSADAALALDALNSMLLRWPSQGVDAKYAALVLDDTFAFFVPPEDASSEVIDALADPVDWNASTNTPTLATGTGTLGDFYKVTVAGSTTLDDVTSWAVGDYAVFDGQVWLRSVRSKRFEQAVVDMLSIELGPDFGKEPSAVLMRAAMQGWSQIQAAFIKAPNATIDRAVMNTMQRNLVSGALES